MAREPSYPKDASVGKGPNETPSPPNKPVEASAPSASEESKGGSDSRRNKHLVAGAAIGIGSAAIVAALLYANRNRRS